MRALSCLTVELVLFPNAPVHGFSGFRLPANLHHLDIIMAAVVKAMWMDAILSISPKTGTDVKGRE